MQLARCSILLTVVLTLLVAACIPPQNASGGGTSIVINGRVIQPAEKAYLEWLIGSTVGPGRYTIDARGNAGLEGQPPTVNLTELAARRNNTNGNRGTRGVYGGTDHTGRASWFESDGKCKYIETPSGGFSSGC